MENSELRVVGMASFVRPNGFTIFRRVTLQVERGLSVDEARSAMREWRDANGGEDAARILGTLKVVL